MKKLKLFLLPKDEVDKNAIIEIRAGTGGLEASLFGRSFKMYEKVSHKKMVFGAISISKVKLVVLKKCINKR